MESAAASRPTFRWACLGPWRLRVRQTGIAFGAAVVSAILGGIVSWFVDGARGGEEWFEHSVRSEGAVVFIPSVLIVAPLIETLLLAWMLLLLLERRVNRHVAVFFAATLWTAIHLTRGPSALAVFFPFLAFSYLFVTRRDPPHEDGFLLATMAHFFINLIAVIAGVCSGAFTG